ncbi:hypothetical protein Poly30_44280 [Planctomycetes bacterium Poly30]|uniref:Uncharacterized protein n=1 Tax=Saltatorellus ferox TaxID=2528018 RepID=A0A518EXS1_9BACT|nr:hypothetical protein Poly30_44130 [Planctomycetes bacterium Poly30]QDV08873.1 hypothetical protein Poly30_44280 [Planctomycetes bacterium Poly30]
MLLAFQSEFQVFSVDSGGVDTLAFLAVAVTVATVAAHICAAYFLFTAAARFRRDQNAGPALFPPFLWGLLGLIGTITSIGVVGLLFVVLHYTDWCHSPERDEDIAPSPRLGSTHARRVRELKAELAELREQNRDAEQE